jgi:hypothetical protein
MIWELFLSASVPRFVEGRDPTYAQNVPPDVAFEINEAVVALTAATLLSKGRLVFGGHPSITPLVAQTVFDVLNVSPPEANSHQTRLGDLVDQVTGGSDSPRDTGSVAESLAGLPRSERPIVVYQSRLYEDVLVDEVSMLEGSAIAEVVLTPVIADGQAVHPPRTELSAMRTSKQIRNDCLDRMRSDMTGRPNLVAMFALGGLEGVEEEAAYFRRNHWQAPIYLLVGTGGATRSLALRRDMGNLVVVDRGYIEALFERNGVTDIELSDTDLRIDPEGAAPLPMTPYSMIMTLLVQELSSPTGSR